MRDGLHHRLRVTVWILLSCDLCFSFLFFFSSVGLLINETLESTATQHTLINLTPGRLYNVTMVTESGGLQNSRTIETRTGREEGRKEGRRVELQTDNRHLSAVPSAVRNVTTATNGTSLWLSWQRADGEGDALNVQLLSNETVRWESSLPFNTTHVTIDQLTPGSAYRLLVTSQSGELRNQSESRVHTGETALSHVFSLSLSIPHLVLVWCSAPAAASHLSLTPSSDGGLVLTWSPPAGHWERYRLFLFDGSQKLVSAELHRDALNFTFPGTGLTPGVLYRAALRVESGGVTAESSCDGSTGEQTPAPATFTAEHIMLRPVCFL